MLSKVAISIVLLVLGTGLTYYSWKLIYTMSNREINHHFAAWWTKGANQEETEGLRQVNGILMAVGIMFFGMLMLVGALINLIR